MDVRIWPRPRCCPSAPGGRAAKWAVLCASAWAAAGGAEAEAKVAAPTPALVLAAGPTPAPAAGGNLDPLTAPAAGALVPPAEARGLRVVVKSALERALVAREPACGRALGAELARLLRWRGDVARKVRPGDTLEVLYVPHPKPTEPELLAVHYDGELLHLHAYRFAAAGDGIARYYDGDGHRVEPTMRHPPVPRYWQITETVQRGRGRRHHRGDDFRAPEGSPVVLSFPGRVTRTNWSRRHNGRCIEVQLDAGYLAHFLHLQVLAPEVRPGRRLEAGAVLGTVGNTGRSTGAHLHYELLRHGQPVEPLKVHGTVQDQLHGRDLPAFVAWRDALRGRLRAEAPRPE